MLTVELDAVTVKQIFHALQAENERLKRELEATKRLLNQQKKERGDQDTERKHPLSLDKPLYSMGDLAQYYGTSTIKIFEKLAELKVVHRYPTDIAIHNRPTQEYFETGWFWRVERFSTAKRDNFFQTLIVAGAVEPLMRLLEERE